MESSGEHHHWMSVKNAMTREVISIRASDKVKDAWLVMMEAGISGAPVVDDSGSLLGILSVTDIHREILERIQKARTLREAVAHLSDPGAEEKEELRELSLAIRAVADETVLSTLPKDQHIHSLSPEDSLDRAIRLMAEHSVNRLPVVKDNHVVGIITRQDVIWVISGRPKQCET